MHSLSLQPHPQGGASSIDAIAVSVERPTRERLALRYVIVGEAVRHIAIPRSVRGRPGRHDELWRHTCFELFVGLGDDAGYAEYNFAPSGDWAAYSFDAYRAGMAKPRVDAPVVDSWLHFPRGADRVRGTDTDIAGVSRDFAAPFFELAVAVDLSWLIVQQPSAPWSIGLSAVIEEKNGSKSYWALNHGPGAPDFHRRDCFALELPAARPA